MSSSANAPPAVGPGAQVVVVNRHDAACRYVDLDAEQRDVATLEQVGEHFSYGVEGSRLARRLRRPSEKCSKPVARARRAWQRAALDTDGHRHGVVDWMQRVELS